MKKILVGLDGSPRADGVFAYATSMARLTGAKLVLFRSYRIPPEMTLAWPISDKPLEHALRTEAQEYLDTYASELPSELRGAVRVAVGVPWRAVCAAAVEENADLIIVGSHGYSAIDHLLGTTAARIVNHAERPVLVVRGAVGGAG